MSKIVTFFRSLFKSCTNPNYYIDIFRAKFSFSVKYFFLFQLITVVITASTILIPLYAFNLAAEITKVAQAYPQDLEISVTHGKIAVNQPLPYAIPLGGKESQMGTDPVKNLIVFDTAEDFGGVENFSKYHAYIVATDSVIYTRSNSSSGEIKAYPLPEDSEDFTINAQMVTAAKNAILNHPIVSQKLYIPFIWAATLLVVLPFLFFVRWLTVMYYSIFTLIVAKLFKKSLFANYTFTYGKILQISLHSITPIVVIAYLSTWLERGWSLAGVWYFLAYLVWTCIVLNRVAVKLVAHEVMVEEAQVLPVRAKSAAKKMNKSAKRKR